jgi:hypothetical protein
VFADHVDVDPAEEDLAEPFVRDDVVERVGGSDTARLRARRLELGDDGPRVVRRCRRPRPLPFRE